MVFSLQFSAITVLNIETENLILVLA